MQQRGLAPQVPSAARPDNHIANLPPASAGGTVK